MLGNCLLASHFHARTEETWIIPLTSSLKHERPSDQEVAFMKAQPSSQSAAHGAGSLD